VVVAAVTVVLSTVPAACGGTSRDATVEPLAGEPPSAPSAVPSPSPTVPSPTDPATPAPGPGGPDPTSPGPATAREPARDLVDEVLDRYDRALTGLAAHPAALDDPAHPARVAWEAVVVPGSVLAADVTGRIRARAAEGVVVVPPPPLDRSFVHRALAVVSGGAPGEVAFTWCGWSPGIGRTTDGVVVDDTVAHSRGTGRIVQDPSGLRVASLDETELVVLGPGSPDPCPREAEVAGRTGGPP
jgi:hypothetical protein